MPNDRYIVKMKKQRIFYLDFIRAIAVCLIVLTHFNAIYIYMWDEVALQKVVFTWKIANLYIGDFGVSLFLIISGAALMYTYEEHLDIKEFYKKRFLSIFPMFWFAYFIVFLHSFWLTKGIDQGIPKQNILLSVIGMDGYLNGLLPTFYKIGEWFLGFIIIFYIVFPILRKLIIEHPTITMVVSLILYCLINIKYLFKINRSICLITRLPELLFGMYFVRYIKKIDWKIALAGIIVMVMNSVIQIPLNKDIQTTYVGIATFVFLVYISSFLGKYNIIKRICNILSKYSYAIFLTHHYIITQITSKYDLNNISILESYILFLLCCCVIAVFSYILFVCNRHILVGIKSILKEPV